MVYNTEVILWPRDFAGNERTLIVNGTSLTIRSSLVLNSVNPADYTVAEDVITATGNYRLFMNTPLRFTPAAGTTFRVV